MDLHGQKKSEISDHKDDDCCFLERPQYIGSELLFLAGSVDALRWKVVVITSLMGSVVAGDCISSQRVSCRTRI